MLAYYFLCINQWIPEVANGLRIYGLAGETGVSCFLCYGAGAVFLLTAGEAIGQTGLFRK